ncbi:hypothetical protein FJY69_01570 [candidate division WOR-3 bacterium]|nr:hypothetical protein [candidate division WOR-3 bacterium]
MVRWSIVIILIPLSALLVPHSSLMAQWHGVYHDSPLALEVRPDRASYHPGDTFRVTVSATNTGDRLLLLRRDWREQLVFYHLNPLDSFMVEWPGRVNTATWLKPDDTVLLRPGQRYSFTRLVYVFIPEDTLPFPFRVKLVGVKDYGRVFATWQGETWSPAIVVNLSPR